MNNLGYLVSTFVILVLTVPSYCDLEISSHFEIFDVSDSTDDIKISHRVQPILDQLGNTKRDVVLRNSIIALNRIAHQKDELLSKQMQRHDFKQNFDYGNFILPEWYSKGKDKFYETMSNIQHIIDTWVNLNHVLMDRTESQLRSLSSGTVLPTTLEI